MVITWCCDQSNVAWIGDYRNPWPPLSHDMLTRLTLWRPQTRPHEHRMWPACFCTPPAMQEHRNYTDRFCQCMKFDSMSTLPVWFNHFDSMNFNSNSPSDSRRAQRHSLLILYIPRFCTAVPLLDQHSITSPEWRNPGLCWTKGT